jgi:hypothetical protein
MYTKPKKNKKNTNGKFPNIHSDNMGPMCM